ncbi:hypothetical protein AVEN_139272-1 [Araneus ventricosus]|uniref:Uncharacterized protein n=1 Tax=Araneus ventricosus TaxID=182803 RepID=A0A4Y2MEG8_ARAVE|nr:hypothetical protein AVEN_139272-1 [Araneus ventricosus]
MHQAHIYDEVLKELGFESGTLQSRNRDLNSVPHSIWQLTHWLDINLYFSVSPRGDIYSPCGSFLNLKLSFNCLRFHGFSSIFIPNLGRILSLTISLSAPDAFLRAKNFLGGIDAWCS